jgi:hypothetical protein
MLRDRKGGWAKNLYSESERPALSSRVTKVWSESVQSSNNNTVVVVVFLALQPSVVVFSQPGSGL